MSAEHLLHETESTMSALQTPEIDATLLQSRHDYGEAALRKRIPPLTKTCPTCGKPFHYWAYQTWKKFCDRYCASDYSNHRVFQISEADLRYLACALDTEGSIAFSKVVKNGHHSVSPHIDIINTNLEWLEYAKEIMRRVNSKIEVRDRGKGWRTIYSLYVPTTVCRALLPRLLPYLIIKKAHAQTLIAFWAMRRKNGIKTPYGDEEKELIRRMKELNNPQYGGTFGGVVKKP